MREERGMSIDRYMKDELYIVKKYMSHIFKKNSHKKNKGKTHEPYMLKNIKKTRFF